MLTMSNWLPIRVRLRDVRRATNARNGIRTHNWSFRCCCCYCGGGVLFFFFSFLVSFCFAFDHSDSKQFISSAKRVLLVVAGGNRLAIFASVCFFFFFLARFRGFWMLGQSAWVRARPQTLNSMWIWFRWIRVVCVCVFFSALARTCTGIDCWLLFDNKMSRVRLFQVAVV